VKNQGKACHRVAKRKDFNTEGTEGPQSSRRRADGVIEVMVEMELDVMEWSVGILQAAQEESAFERADDELGEFVRLDARIDFTVADAFGDDFGEADGPGLQGFFGAGAEVGVAVVGFDGGVHEGAAAGDEAIAPFDKVVDHFFEAEDGVADFVDAFEAAGDGFFPGVIEGFPGELLLAGEMAVDAAFLEAGGLHQVGEGSAFVALSVEERGCLADDFAAGEFTLGHFAGHNLNASHG
jgi:hypothetical protein